MASERMPNSPERDLLGFLATVPYHMLGEYDQWSIKTVKSCWRSGWIDCLVPDMDTCEMSINAAGLAALARYHERKGTRDG